MQVLVQVSWARLGDAHDGLLDLLDPVERGRHAATVGPGDRDRFLLGVALSRLLLGELLDVPPADVPLRRVCARCGGPHGKVRLDRSAAPRLPEYGFSVTHSGDVVGVAVCRGVEVGLDVEDAYGAVDVDTAARTALSDAELAALYARPPAERRLAFLRTWTRKEAVLKALGVGLGAPLRRLEVSAPEHAPTVRAWPDQIAVRPPLAMADMVVDGVHPAAVAATGAGGARLVRHDGSAAVSAYGRRGP
ncbi:4'-phosphopantetheinyl transferase superfamily protein [Streptomyces sp. NBC_01275]|uniref:4'-phosphopantetheinyl transferase family protein n=1 Tax=Streptomyces sp. NBC_01275 TaxID=2903807 RepID=UPI00224FDA13|nr:4'-phosphopantetheinyl transferase superfamily protein [Streptomyces sp. NBC_01275]MCX4762239.1 4'-phosphopantetheinyl transferase superfamily protein [Streptomyces sp. NBC_01275]